MKKTLVILAAGIGNRYGGAKQITPVGPCGEKIIDFSMYDAYKAGFEKIVFIIRKSLEADFREVIGDPVSEFMEVDYVFQEIDPEYAEKGRNKPFGTAEAIALCRGHVEGPFAVINADDYYGYHCYALIGDLLEQMDGEGEYCMIGYRIENTVTDKGSVARGVCRTENGMLCEINERTHIEKRGECAEYTEDGENWVPLSAGTPVSMNFWGFTPDIFDHLDVALEEFRENELLKNPLKAECYLPNVVGKLLEEGKITVKVQECPDKWYGVTYKEDTPALVEALDRLTKEGRYPSPIWG
ncbi:MAG: nucleotidyltransferase [Oscillospiraceae bacterium]|nr:nucleotidyltransferase [Oscillospiraceae bacterium]